MSYTKLWIHAVWGTKNRHPFLTKEIKEKIISHIKENATSKGIYINRINGHTEHLHALISLKSDMSVSRAMQLIKGESAFWVNKNNLTPVKFTWAEEYFALSVSESQLGRVRAYIDNQEEHHRKITFADEYEKFLREYQAAQSGLKPGQAR
jgi:REP element-mobilizing transposase RayT